MTTKLRDVVEANRLLVALGGEDQMQRIAAASIEKQLDLQNRIDRALAYAAQTPPNSSHARQIARILDGSITLDDELNEVKEHDRPMPESVHYEAGQGALGGPAPTRQSLPAPVKRTRGPNKKPKVAKAPPEGRYESGLTGRSSAQRREFRAWMHDNGYHVPHAGPVSPDLVAIYDRAMEEERMARAAERKAQRDGQLPIA
jgi:hypothetical protein